MSGPSGVSYPHVRHNGLGEVDLLHLQDFLLEDLHLPRAFYEESFSSRRGSVHAEPCRVITSVLESLETGYEDIKNLLPGFRR